MISDWVVWSNEHMAWWRPNHRGYSTDLRGAGLYSEAEAKHIEKHARGGQPTGTGQPPEVAMPLAQALLADDTGRSIHHHAAGSVGELIAELIEGTPFAMRAEDSNG